jgi:hypothetical protein
MPTPLGQAQVLPQRALGLYRTRLTAQDRWCFGLQGCARAQLRHTQGDQRECRYFSLLLRLSPTIENGRNVLIDSEQLATEHDSITWSEDEFFKK